MLTQDITCVRHGATRQRDPQLAAAELREALYHPDAALTLFFCSPSYPLPELGAAMRDAFPGTPLIGCTTAGEIGPFGYVKGAISGVTFAEPDFHVASMRIDDIEDLPMYKAEQLARDIVGALRERGLEPNGRNTFGFLLVDGLSNQEEVLVSSLFGQLGDIQLFGGSAGDNVDFQKTEIFHDGRFHQRSAVFSLIHTTRPFTLFKTEHFVATEKKLIVTEADPARRLVTEINGESAAREYARIMGVDLARLAPTVFATHPVVVRVGGSNYVRSVMKVNEDESINFACAIDEGIVLSLAEPVDLIDNLNHLFSDIQTRIGEPELILGCDCLFRAIEMEQNGIKEAVGQIFAEHNMIGFSTYGEQYNAMHVNQTLTGVAIGHAR
ncbi:MAG: nitric oxide-sensing protein NosP [Rhodothermales bacterium]